MVTTKTVTDTIDVVLKELGIKKYPEIDVLFKKLGLLGPISSNHILNGGFEQDRGSLEEWTAYGIYNVTALQKHSGAYSAMLGWDGAPADHGEGWITQSFSAVPVIRLYKFGAWIYCWQNPTYVTIGYSDGSNIAFDFAPAGGWVYCDFIPFLDIDKKVTSVTITYIPTSLDWAYVDDVILTLSGYPIDILLKKTVKAPTNVIQIAINGGFETGDLTGWSTAGTTTVSTTHPHSGTYCAYVPKIGDGLYQLFPTQPLVTDIASFDVWVYTEDNRNIDIGISYIDGGTTSVVVSSEGVWTKINLLSYADPNKHIYGIYFSSLGPSFYVDDLTLYPYGYPIDVQLRKILDIIDTLDVVFKKMKIPLTYIADTILKKYKAKQFYSVDALIEEIGLTKPYSIDMLLEKLDLRKFYAVDMIAQALGIPEPYTIDMVAKQLGIKEPYTVDTILSNARQSTYSIDLLLDRLHIPASFVIDVLFKTVVAVGYNIDIFLQYPKLESTYILDVILQAAIIITSIGGGHPEEMDKKIEQIVRYVERNFAFRVRSLTIISAIQRNIETEELKVIQKRKSEKSVSKLDVAKEFYQSKAMRGLDIAKEEISSKSVVALDVIKEHSQVFSLVELEAVKESLSTTFLSELHLSKKELAQFRIVELEVLKEKSKSVLFSGLEILSKKDYPFLVEQLTTKKKKMTKRELLKLLDELDEMDE